MISKRLVEVLGEKMWNTSGIISGHDKGAIQAREKSIKETHDAILNNFVIVDKDNIDMLISVICDHVILRNTPTQIYEPPIPGNITIPATPEPRTGGLLP